MGQFTFALQAFAEKAMENAEEAIFRISLDVGEALVIRSPVDTGFFRANWRFGIDTPDLTVTDPGGTSERPAPPPTIAVSGKMLGRIVYWTNNTAYGSALETGHSNQAPQGIVRITGMEFQETVDRIVNGLN